MPPSTSRAGRLLAVCLFSAFALALPACGSDDEGAGSSGGAGSGAGKARSGVEDGAFPATIEHRYGSTTVEQAPERVVVAGLREQDAVLALGVVPVGTTEWYGNHPGAIFPWAKEALGNGETPTVLKTTDGLETEKIAALQPDLILSIYSGLKKKEYDTLSKIAPVVAQPRDEVDWGSSWQEETLMTGEALGRPAAAQQLVDKTEAEIDEVAAEHPEFKGQTAAVTSAYQGVWVYGPQDARTRFLTELGFRFPSELRTIGGKTGFGGQLANERYDLLDLGTVLWFADPKPAAKLKEDPVYGALKVRKEGRDVFIAEKGTLYEAISFPSVLSMPTLLDGLVPKLAAAADGDPSTDPGT
jgi:iron complex transport system substrate-binding protein